MGVELEKEKGFIYTVEGSSNLDDFAKSILMLTNMKCNNMGILDFRTFHGSNTIRILATDENDSYIESYFGDIKHKESCSVLYVTGEDVQSYINEEYDKALDNDESLELVFDYWK